MKRKAILTIFLGALLFLILILGVDSYLNRGSDPGQVDIFVGVDPAYDDVEAIKRLIDEVKDYTNFFVIGSTGITLDVAKLNDVCHYLNNNELYFAPFTHTTDDFNQSQWISEAKQRWSRYFWGLYVYDEPAGHQIDRDRDGERSYMLVEEASNYSDAANKYVVNLNAILAEYQPHGLPLITSDYVLYEYDYRGGYDVVLTQYAWNLSRPLNTALCRGAATMNNKEWGVMITYTYDEEPYLASEQEIYQDMVTAYQNGAKYILVFDYARDPTTNVAHSILQDEHLDALRRFWQYVKEHPRTSGSVDDRMAYVLPKDYGYGLRGPSDWIWGLFRADNLSSKIWKDANTWVEQNKPQIDVVYEDSLPYGTFNYSKLVFWNGTIIKR